MNARNCPIDHEIEAAIPHRGPMLLVDEIVQRDATSIVCRKTFRGDEFFFQGHYPGNPIVPGVVLCECGVQAGAILLARIAGGQGGVPVLTRLNDVKFKQLVRPGDSIEMHVKLDETVSRAYYMTAHLEKSKQTLARFSFACTVVRPESEGA
jgi:3-hydroxyacyl-[acyl-carrier-protein] dehydratase